MVVGRAEEKILDYQTVHRHARRRVQGNTRVARRLAGIGECREVGAYFVPNARYAGDGGHGGGRLWGSTPAGGAHRWHMLRGSGPEMSSRVEGSHCASGRHVRPPWSRPRGIAPHVGPPGPRPLLAVSRLGPALAVPAPSARGERCAHGPRGRRPGRPSVQPGSHRPRRRATAEGPAPRWPGPYRG
jgi:hypothetical protein